MSLSPSPRYIPGARLHAKVDFSRHHDVSVTTIRSSEFPDIFAYVTDEEFYETGRICFFPASRRLNARIAVRKAILDAIYRARVQLGMYARPRTDTFTAD